MWMTDTGQRSGVDHLKPPSGVQFNVRTTFLCDSRVARSRQKEFNIQNYSLSFTFAVQIQEWTFDGCGLRETKNCQRCIVGNVGFRVETCKAGFVFILEDAVGRDARAQ